MGRQIAIHAYHPPDKSGRVGLNRRQMTAGKMKIIGTGVAKTAAIFLQNQAQLQSLARTLAVIVKEPVQKDFFLCLRRYTSCHHQHIQIADLPSETAKSQRTVHIHPHQIVAEKGAGVGKQAAQQQMFSGHAGVFSSSQSAHSL